MISGDRKKMAFDNVREIVEDSTSRWNSSDEKLTMQICFKIAGVKFDLI